MSLVGCLVLFAILRALFMKPVFVVAPAPLYRHVAAAAATVVAAEAGTDCVVGIVQLIVAF